MAQPPPYNRAYNFADFQAENPTTPLPGQSVDEEYARVKQTLDAILANLKKIQRDDTALANRSVGYDQLKEELDGFGFNPPSEWEPDTNYVERDTVFYDASFYRCVESHVSSSAFDSSKWDMIADFTSATTEAQEARDDAQAAQLAAENAASDAQGYAVAASNSAGAAALAKTAAENAASDAQGYAVAASNSAGAAALAKTAAENAQSAAEGAQLAAENAQSAAEGAKTDAENAADRAEAAAITVEYPVSYKEQILDPSDQAQARSNIGLGSAAVKNEGDFATASQGSKADAALPNSGGEMTGGLSFGSAAASSATDLTRHIALYGTQYGFTVTASNLNYASAHSHSFYSGENLRGKLDNAGNWTVSGKVTVGAGPTADMDAATKQYVDALKWTETAPVATTSGTAIDWTSIPAGVSEIELWFDRVSVNSTSHILLQVGTGGVPKADGYVSGSGMTGAGFRTTSTAGFVIYSNISTGSGCGAIRLRRTQGDTWVAEHNIGNLLGDGGGVGAAGGGSVTLSGNLDMLRLTSEGGTQTFDAGSVQVRYR